MRNLTTVYIPGVFYESGPALDRRERPVATVVPTEFVHSVLMEFEGATLYIPRHVYRGVEFIPARKTLSRCINSIRRAM